MNLLSVEGLSVSYGDLIAVQDVSFSVEEGSTFALLGANGAGKTSILRAISGLSPARSGSITSGTTRLNGLTPHEVARSGIAHVPEGRRIFYNLSVEANLTVSFLQQRTKLTLPQAIDSIFTLFPRLAERRRQVAGTLSGGEQQMLAIGRAMLNFPNLLMLDEPSLGLSPVITDLMYEQLSQIRKSGMTILLVEQNATCLELATDGVVLANGKIELSGSSSELAGSEFVRRAYLGI